MAKELNDGLRRIVFASYERTLNDLNSCGSGRRLFYPIWSPFLRLWTDLHEHSLQSRLVPMTVELTGFRCGNIQLLTRAFPDNRVKPDIVFGQVDLLASALEFEPIKGRLP